MFERLRRLFGLSKSVNAAEVPLLHWIDPAELEPLVDFGEGAVVLKDDSVVDWLARVRTSEQELMRRSLVGAYLDLCCDPHALDRSGKPVLRTPHKRWRSPHAEGLTPATGVSPDRMDRVMRICASEIHNLLSPVLGTAPIAPLGVICLAPFDVYLNFESGFRSGGEDLPRSGGVYIHKAIADTSIVLIDASRPNVVMQVLAHELTHHAIAELLLPAWLQEGYTQIMEERVSGSLSFEMTGEKRAEHRAFWNEERVLGFLDGSTFSTDNDNACELSYHLAQWIVRLQLETRPKEFFAFTKACSSLGVDAACEQQLGQTPQELVSSTLGYRR